MKHFFIVIVTCFVVLNIHAQGTDSFRYVYNNQTIYRYGGYFMKGNERLKFSDLKGEFSMSDLGFAGYFKAKRYKTTSFVFRAASLITAIASFSVIAKNGNRNTIYALIAGEVLLGYGAGKYIVMSNQSLDRALWQRNKDVLYPNR